MTAGSPSSRLGELLAGWRTLVGATLGASVGVHVLPFYTAGLFMVALETEKGWSRSAISLGASFFALGLGLAGPVVGALCDRFGDRRVIIPGLVFQIAALIALSRLETLTAFYLLMSGMALLGAGSGALGYARIINRRFHASKGTAMGLMITGTAACSALAPIAVQAVISSHGWRAGYLSIAAAVVVVGPLALLLLRGDVAAVRDASAALPLRYADLVRDRTFRLLAGAIFLASLAVPGVITHLAGILKDGGIGPASAALMLGLVGLAQIFARLGTGMLADRFFAPRVAATIFALSALGFAIFGLFGAPVAVIGALAAGLAYGAEADLLGYLVGRYFPPDQFGRVFGLLCTVFFAGSALSPLWYGWSVDHFGGYHVGLAGASMALLLSALTFLRMPAFGPRHSLHRR
jgi:MFS family permease